MNETLLHDLNEDNIFGKPEGSITAHILLYLFQILAFVSSNFPGRRYLFTGILLALFIESQRNLHFTNNLGLAQPFCIQWSFLLASLEKLILSGKEGPEAHFWRPDHGIQEALQYPPFGFAKIGWAVMLLLNQRGVGWNHQVKNVPVAPETTKSAFLKTRIWQLFKSFLMADLLFQLGIRIFYTNYATGLVGNLDTKHITLAYKNPLWNPVALFVFAATPYFALTAQYTLFSILSVLIGFGSPQDWPPMFNPIGTATTVRSFWGKYWHQVVRRGISTWSTTLVRACSVAQGTSASSYMQLWFGFLVSGYFHSTSHLILPAPINVTVYERTHGIFVFFVIQAAAITFEDFVKWLWSKKLRMGEEETRWRRTLGYLWVTGVLFWSVKYPALAYMRTRVGIESPFPVSVMKEWVKLIPVPAPEF
ncbi:hypothetical protein K458DRAFT_287911 [Lentithecium fluviatile CBS 122367]|uniref:Wax synthase domain-containing protein n=1 Tax=Lentithecium fluviatile CBS 122367 TaxID=1168545 RepID=A0A6G1JK81_9PLEO|nr:hypothetical protein K458DRAFT_287911 [Lentithecium fluviatile CBS 122367]